MLSGTKSSARLVGFSWLSDSRISFYRQPSRGVDTYSLWAINIDGTKPKLLVPGKVEDGYFAYAGIQDVMEEDDDHILISYNESCLLYTSPSPRDVEESPFG